MSTDEADRKMLREVHAAIVGNEAMGYKGLAARMSEAEEKIANHSRKFYTLAGVFTGINIAIAWVKARMLGGGS